MANPGKVAIVTGGGQGIGRCIVKRLLGLGMGVAIAELDEEAGKETEAAYRALGEVKFFQTDVGDEASVERTVQQTVKRFGRLDALINNAGVSDPNNDAVRELPLDDWNRVIRTNLTGPFLMSKHAIRRLERAKGAIVNIASTRALQSEPNTEAYSTSKAGLVGFTHSLAMSLGPDVRVNCVSPGWIDTREWKKRNHPETPALTEGDHAQHPVGRVGVPEDIAALVAFLVSEEAGFITGQNFVVDGGMTRKMIYEE